MLYGSRKDDSSDVIAHVLASLGGRIPFILDAGAIAAGLESTIVRPEADRVVLLRPGPVTAALLALKYPLAGLGLCIACLIAYLKPEAPGARKA